MKRVLLFLSLTSLTLSCSAAQTTARFLRAMWGRSSAQLTHDVAPIVRSAQEAPSVTRGVRPSFQSTLTYTAQRPAVLPSASVNQSARFAFPTFSAHTPPPASTTTQAAAAVGVAGKLSLSHETLMSIFSCPLRNASSTASSESSEPVAFIPYQSPFAYGTEDDDNAPLDPDLEQNAPAGSDESSSTELAGTTSTISPAPVDPALSAVTALSVPLQNFQPAPPVISGTTESTAIESRGTDLSTSQEFSDLVSNSPFSCGIPSENQLHDTALPLIDSAPAVETRLPAAPPAFTHKQEEQQEEEKKEQDHSKRTFKSEFDRLSTLFGALPQKKTDKDASPQAEKAEEDSSAKKENSSSAKKIMTGAALGGAGVAMAVASKGKLKIHGSTVRTLMTSATQEAARTIPPVITRQGTQATTSASTTGPSRLSRLTNLFSRKPQEVPTNTTTRTLKEKIKAQQEAAQRDAQLRAETARRDAQLRAEANKRNAKAREETAKRDAKAREENIQAQAEARRKAAQERSEQLKQEVEQKKQAELQRIEQQRLEQQERIRITRERIEQERVARQERQRKEAERIEQERIAERERLARQEQQRLKQESERVEQEHLVQEETIEQQRPRESQEQQAVSKQSSQLPTKRPAVGRAKQKRAPATRMATQKIQHFRAVRTPVTVHAISHLVPSVYYVATHPAPSPARPPLTPKSAAKPTVPNPSTSSTPSLLPEEAPALKPEEKKPEDKKEEKKDEEGDDTSTALDEERKAQVAAQETEDEKDDKTDPFRKKIACSPKEDGDEHDAFDESAIQQSGMSSVPSSGYSAPTRNATLGTQLNPALTAFASAPLSAEALKQQTDAPYDTSRLENKGQKTITMRVGGGEKPRKPAVLPLDTPQQKPSLPHAASASKRKASPFPSALTTRKPVEKEHQQSLLEWGTQFLKNNIVTPLKNLGAHATELLEKRPA